MERTSFIGVTTDSDHDVASGNTGLYEFNTAEGHHIYLHDTDLVAVTYEPGPVPRLTTTFRYDSAWVPESLRATPVIVIAFDNVRITEWEEDAEALTAMETSTDASAAAGQMSLFDWDGDRTFDLLAFALSIRFTADRAEVTTRSGSA